MKIKLTNKRFNLLLVLECLSNRSHNKIKSKFSNIYNQSQNSFILPFKVKKILIKVIKTSLTKSNKIISRIDSYNRKIYKVNNNCTPKKN